MNKALNGDELKKMIPWDINIILYPDIEKYDTIDDMLEPNNCCILLFETDRGENMSTGHWTCLLKTVDDENNESVNFFDSYGFKPDDQKKKINKYFMEMINMRDNFLSELLYRAANEMDNVVEYNEKQLQKMARNIHTCGRWISLRLLLKDISMNDFQKFMEYLKQNYNNNLDKLVVNLTQPVLEGKMSNFDFKNFLNELYQEYKIKKI